MNICRIMIHVVISQLLPSYSCCMIVADRENNLLVCASTLLVVQRRLLPGRQLCPPKTQGFESIHKGSEHLGQMD